MAKRQKYGKETIFVKHKRKKFNKKEREFLFERDGYKCCNCGCDLSELPTERVLDHIIPLAQYGSNRLDNIQLLCNKCDKEKKAYITPEAVRLRLNELKKRVYGKRT